MAYAALVPAARLFLRSPLRRRVATACALAVLVVLAGASALSADDVHLYNGRVFEDVVAEVTDTHVIVELAIGRLRFPVDQVREVVRSETPLADFHDRRQALLHDPASAAASWVDLAAWARSRGLERAWRETALLAARLDPAAPGLEPLMLELGCERDEAIGWMPRAEVMRRRGLVEYRGSWLPPERVAELRRAEREAAATTAEADRVAAGLRSRRGASDNEVALASIELAREALRADRDAAAPPRGVPLGQAIFVGGWPWLVGGVAPATPEAREAWDALAVRQPGSIIPLEAFQRRLDR
ncbi:MAG TPA: hypothetical protein VNB06_06220 [Thermoanaerobaculia bacterium]|nr:hypothetical protein [Thermoanaerobaculia bacterium]